MKRVLPYFVLLLGAFATFEISEALARVGGGHTYSGDSGGGGSRSSSFGGSSGELDLMLVFRILHFCFSYPKVGIPLLLIAGLVLYFASKSEPQVSLSPATQARLQQSALKGSTAKNQIRKFKKEHDAGFSTPGFLDFTAQLYATLQRARGERKLEDYSLFLSEAAQRRLEQISSAIREVRGVTLGSLRIEQLIVIPQSQTARIDVVFEANLTEFSTSSSGPGTGTGTGAEGQAWYTEEVWTFVRSLSQKSPEPEKLRQIACPSCGSPPQAENGKCRSCGIVINTGAFGWTVQTIQIRRRDQKPPLLGVSVPEVGTELPTLFDPELQAGKAELDALGPEFSLDRACQRGAEIFLKLQEAWSTRDWKKARPFETDSLFQSHAYWIAEYRRQKLVNRLERPKIAAVVPVKIELDPFFVAVTARISASLIDTTVSEDGRLVCGDPKHPRPFTEYWTFIRSRQAQAPVKDSHHCPACGAELQIAETGHCEFCDARVTSGRFDWVASRIEQDEAYHG